MKAGSVFSLAALCVLVAAPAFAAPNLMKACRSDLKKFGCTGKTEAEAHECLEKNEKDGVKNEGFTHACHEAHEAYEKKTGKVEKDEGEAHSESGENQK